MFEQALTVEQAVHSLKRGGRFKLRHNTRRLSELLAMRGHVIGSGVDTNAYDIPGHPDLVLLRTVGSEYRPIREVHAIKVIQLALAGVLYDHAYNDDPRVGIHPHTGAIITLSTPAIWVKAQEYGVDAAQRLVWLARAREYGEAARGERVYRHYPVIKRRLETESDRLSPNTRDAYRQVEAAIETTRRVPGLYEWVKSRIFDTHEGNWRVLDDGTVYLADGFV